MSHLALDVMSGARARLAWPFVDTPSRFPSSRWRTHGWSRFSSSACSSLWPGRQRLRTVAPFMLGAAVGFLCLKGALLDRALRRIASRSGVAASRRSALGIADGMGRVRPDAGGASRLAHQQSRRSGHRAPVAAAPTGVRAGDGVAIAGHREELPARARARVCGRGRRERGTHGSALVGSALLPGARRSADGAIACGLWFGGVFGPDGRALTQEVTVGRGSRRARRRGEAEQHVAERRPSPIGLHVGRETRVARSTRAIPPRSARETADRGS